MDAADDQRGRARVHRRGLLHVQARANQKKTEPQGRRHHRHRQDRRAPVALGRDGFQLSRRFHGVGGRREAHAPDRARHREGACRSSSFPPAAARACTKACSASCRWPRPAPRSAYHAKARLPYISVLTDPAYAGVMASYASVGDLILAEPGAHDRLRRPARHQGHHAGRTAARVSKPPNSCSTTASSTPSSRARK